VEKYSGATNNVRMLLPGYTGTAIKFISYIKSTPKEVNNVTGPGM